MLDYWNTTLPLTILSEKETTRYWEEFAVHLRFIPSSVDLQSMGFGNKQVSSVRALHMEPLSFSSSSMPARRITRFQMVFSSKAPPQQFPRAHTFPPPPHIPLSSPLQITTHINTAGLLASGTRSFSPPFLILIFIAANTQKGQEKQSRSYLLMVFFVSFVERRTYPSQRPLQTLLLSSRGRFILAGLVLILLTPLPPTTSAQNLREMPTRTKQNRGSQEKKEEKKGGGKSEALQLSVQQALSFEGFFFFFSQHTCTDSQPAALLLFRAAPHQNLNAR